MEWISAETLALIEERKKKKAARNNSCTRARKAKAQEEYSEVHRSVKKNIRADKRNYLETLAAKAEEAAHHGNMMELYATIKKLSGKFSQPERPVRGKDGNIIPDVEDQKSRWVEHFEKSLNRPCPQNPVDIQPADSDLPIDCGSLLRRRSTRPLNN